MARRGYTNKECPGCKGTETRRATDICPTCLGLIETGRQYRERYKALKNTDGLVAVKTPDNWCKPYYQTIHSHEKAEALSETIVKLAKTLSLPAPVETSHSYRYHLENRLDYQFVYFGKVEEKLFRQNFEWNEPRIFEQEILDLLNTLDQLIKDHIQFVYDQGLETGKQALIMLNAGKITLDELNSKKY